MPTPLEQTDPPHRRGAAPTGELSLRILGGLVRYVEDFHGAAAARDLLGRAGLERADVIRGRWASLDQVDAVLAGARPLFADDRSFAEAFGYRVADALGPLRFVAWGPSRAQLFSRSFESIGSLSRISRFETLELSKSHIVVRYFGDRRESRLVCLSRQGQIAALPTLWKLPRAQISEGACIGNGDPWCVYRISWAQRLHRWPLLLGALLGGAIAFGLSGAITPQAAWVLLPLVGGLLGDLVGRHRAHAGHLQVALQASEALHQIAVKEIEATREALEMQERQRRWTRALEDEVAERMAAAQRVAAIFDAERDDSVAAVRGVSHDLRNPLATLTALSWQIRSALDTGVELHRQLLEDHAAALAQLEQLVDELVHAAHGAPLVRAQPVDLEIAGLANRLERRLVALAHGRDIHVRVYAAPDAPTIVAVDPLVFDRVVDNLLTNAAKYTEHGSIVLAIGGDDRRLTLQLTDTGTGIERRRLEQIFEPRGTLPRERGSRSLGVGLSVVVRLLAQIGGRLEVASTLGVGTTFWAHFPVEPASGVEGRSDDPIAGVVTIRPAR